MEAGSNVGRIVPHVAQARWLGSSGGRHGRAVVRPIVFAALCQACGDLGHAALPLLAARQQDGNNNEQHTDDAPNDNADRERGAR